MHNDVFIYVGEIVKKTKTHSNEHKILLWNHTNEVILKALNKY